MSIKVIIEIGHESKLKSKPTPEGFTHDWTLRVKGEADNDISHFVEKVVFNLHESFPKPKRVIKDPPYLLKESGYAGFAFPIDIYFKNRDEPKKTTFNYDLGLQTNGPFNHTQKETFIINNPNEDFRRKLLKGGGVLMNNSNNNFDEKHKDLNDERTQLISKPKLGGSSTNENKKYNKHRLEESKVSNTFANLFGTPITKIAKIPPDSNPGSINVNKQQGSIKNQDKSLSSKEKNSDKLEKSASSKHNKHNSPYKEKQDTSRKTEDKLNLSEKQQIVNQRDETSNSSKPSKKDKTHLKERDRSREKSSSKKSSSPKRSPKRQSPSRNSLTVSAISAENNAKNTIPTSNKNLDQNINSNSKKSKKEKKEKNHDRDRDRDKKGGSANNPSNIIVSHEKEHKKDQHNNKFSLDKFEIKSKEKDYNLNSSSISLSKEKVQVQNSVGTPNQNTIPPAKQEKSEERKHKHKKKDKSKKDENHKEKEKKKDKSERIEKISTTKPSLVTSISGTNSSNIDNKDSHFSLSKKDKHDSINLSSTATSSNNPLNTLMNEISEKGSSDSEIENNSPITKSDIIAENSNSIQQEKFELPNENKINQSRTSKTKKEKNKTNELKEDKKRKRKVSQNQTLMEPPPTKAVKRDDNTYKNGENSGNKIQIDEDVTYPERTLPIDYITELKDLQHKIMTLQDNNDLQQVVELIAATGRYEITSKTFDFDLCALDRNTVQRLQNFFSSS